MSGGQFDPAEQPEERLPSVRPLFLASLVVVGLIIGAWAWADLTLEQVGFLGMGSTALFGAWLVWRYGILGFSYTERSGSEPETDVTPTPVPRELLAPVFALAGVALVLAGTPTGVGQTLIGPVRAGYLLYRFGEQVWGLLLATLLLTTIVVLLVSALIRLDGSLFAMAVVFIAVFGFFALTIYGAYRLQPEQYREAWNDYMEPYRFVVGLFT